MSPCIVSWSDWGVDLVPLLCGTVILSKPALDEVMHRAAIHTLALMAFHTLFSMEAMKKIVEHYLATVNLFYIPPVPKPQPAIFNQI